MVVTPIDDTEVIAVSIAKVGGDTGIVWSDDTAPDTPADVKGYDSNQNVWDDEW